MSGHRVGFGVLAVAAMLALPQVAGATSPAAPPADDVAYRAILAHDWATAEKQLLAGLEKDPTNVFRQLNLAWVYSQTGRSDQAAMIYQNILMSDRDLLAADQSGQGRSVKALAERGLSLMQGRN
jgi:tetratricopeptide (TPR) repeat protein